MQHLNQEFGNHFASAVTKYRAVEQPSVTMHHVQISMQSRRVPYVCLQQVSSVLEVIPVNIHEVRAEKSRFCSLLSVHHSSSETRLLDRAVLY